MEVGGRRVEAEGALRLRLEAEGRREEAIGERR
jgi:hypothetical protein